jgi:hypothetical protein
MSYKSFKDSLTNSGYNPEEAYFHDENRKKIEQAKTGKKSLSKSQVRQQEKQSRGAYHANTHKNKKAA